MEIGTIALKELVWRHFQKNIEITRRTTAQTGLTLACKSNAGAIFDASRDID
jgi:hypothetical protein